MLFAQCASLASCITFHVVLKALNGIQQSLYGGLVTESCSPSFMVDQADHRLANRA